jgi:hypothetical protein
MKLFADKSPMFGGETKLFRVDTRATVNNGVIFFERGSKLETHKSDGSMREQKYIREKKYSLEDPLKKKILLFYVIMARIMQKKINNR